MKIAYFPNQTAQQSEPVWQSFLDGCKKVGITPVENSMSADAAVIWSVLWYGRMRLNKQVYDYYRQQGKPVFVIEVGALKRGESWKLSVNHIDSSGIYGNNTDLDISRPAKLGISLKAEQENRKESILIACQHQQSLQWAGMPSMDRWLIDEIQKIRQKYKMPIVVRPHPRSPFRKFFERDVTFEQPSKINDTYDQFDIDYNHYFVVNYSSSPSIQAAISGIPVICNQKSLAHPVSSPLHDPKVVNRDEWLIKLCHTEWTLDEMVTGTPQQRLIKELTF